MIIVETTVDEINGVSISCGGIYERNRDINGTITKELSISFHLNAKETKILFLGTIVDFNGQKWEVVKFIEADDDKYGSVEIEKLE